MSNLLQSIGGFAADTAISSLAGLAQNRQNYKYSKKLMDYQNSINIANWNMQNEYNSPVAQMQRYRDAGLNPNLVYGNLASSAAGELASPSQSYSSSDFQPKNQILSRMFAAQQIENQRQQNKLISAQVDKTNAETNNIKENTSMLNWQNSDAYREASLSLLTGNAKHANELANIASSDAAFRDSINEANLELTKANRALAADQHILNETQKRLNEMHIDKEYSEVCLNYAKVAYTNATTNLTKQQTQMIFYQTANVIQDTWNKVRSGRLTDLETISQGIDNVIYMATGKHELPENFRQLMTMAVNRLIQKYGNVNKVSDWAKPIVPKKVKLKSY